MTKDAEHFFVFIFICNSSAENFPFTSVPQILILITDLNLITPLIWDLPYYIS